MFVFMLSLICSLKLGVSESVWLCFDLVPMCFVSSPSVCISHNCFSQDELFECYNSVHLWPHMIWCWHMEIVEKVFQVQFVLGFDFELYRLLLCNMDEYKMDCNMYGTD
ncbi:unnamed protein product [Trifolium pratense]|uniref:Uncharacterized protein n=1 Tax=Trifolium pratense TaxID=57577 RepID=A0ACB0INK4_TRIPR|nr:unnamed protein product [Trifolium pratense]